MFNHYQTTTLVQLREDELRRAAEYHQVAELANDTESRPFYAPVLTAMGHKLVELGSSLEERYGEVCREQAAAQLANDVNPNMAAAHAK